ncbi:helix-turn-helix domain-containing protein [Cohnella abietis]|uniref:HTH cro/C1-type domain-containing protein n=1 Tax=Cohnella abietis TaxID=2507935 RepID=A0A3T1DA98_9BACL|nr:helix-turn-helix transcriptional regulator [Cohnella abietis]BBI34954.1 hypothetical protein KCTCHS21_43530 [Cohnella abietis]
MEDLIYAEIGRRIREERDKKGWTQQELSDKTEFTRSSIANIESGRQKIQVHVLFVFATIFNINPVELLPQADALIKNEKDDEKTQDDEMDFQARIFRKLEQVGGNDE